MGISPTDLSNDFIKSGNRLITQLSSDALLKKSETMKQRAKKSIKDALNSDTADPSQSA